MARDFEYYEDCQCRHKGYNHINPNAEGRYPCGVPQRGCGNFTPTKPRTGCTCNDCGFDRPGVQLSPLALVNLPPVNKLPL